jgi:predicted DNA-binding ribbon-helix-helix protein
MRFEPEFWDALRQICIAENVTLADLVQRIDSTAPPGGRTSAIRVYALQYFRGVTQGADAQSENLLARPPVTEVHALAAGSHRAAARPSL